MDGVIIRGKVDYAELEPVYKEGRRANVPRFPRCLGFLPVFMLLARTCSWG